MSVCKQRVFLLLLTFHVESLRKNISSDFVLLHFSVASTRLRDLFDSTGVHDVDAQATSASEGLYSWMEGVMAIAAVAAVNRSTILELRRDMELFYRVIVERGDPSYSRRTTRLASFNKIIRSDVQPMHGGITFGFDSPVEPFRLRRFVSGPRLATRTSIISLSFNPDTCGNQVLELNFALLRQQLAAPNVVEGTRMWCIERAVHILDRCEAEHFAAAMWALIWVRCGRELMPRTRWSQANKKRRQR